MLKEETWKEKRKREFLRECERWPVVIERNGLEATGTKTADSISSIMQQSNYLTNIQCMFSLLREDFERLGLQGPTRKRVKCGGFEYEWFRISDDSNEPTIQFYAMKVS